MTTTPRAGSTVMKPRARLISLIGEELISDEPVALVELVKNAYDADARAVSIKFEIDEEGEPFRIIVHDDGIGMSLDTVLTSWFEPGTTAKKKSDHSPGGRPYQGAKGIGRFASARLGSTLMLETKAKGGADAVLVVLEWGRFDDDSYLEDIAIDYESRAEAVGPHGTTLTIEQPTRGVWTSDAFEELHSRLSRLVSPFNDISDFQIELDIPTYPALSGAVQPPQFLLQPKYLFRGEYRTDGSISGNIEVQADTKRGKPTLIKKSIPAPETKQRVKCGPFKFEIRAWDREADSLRPLAEQLDQTVASLRREMSRYSGVSIYRDGFRVHPYGEAGQDWLGLDLRSRQNPTRNLANNQIVSAIRISRSENPELRDRSTREGMIKNDAHEALESAFLDVLTLLEEERYRQRPRKEAPQRAEPLFEAFDLSSTIQQVRKNLGSDHPLTKLVADKEKEVSEGVDRVQEMLSRLLMSAGLGHMVDIVIHELGAPLGKIGREIALVERELRTMLDEDDWEIIQPRFGAIKGWLEQLYALRQRLDPQTPGKRGRATTFSVGDEIQSCLDLYQALIERQNIDVRIKAPTQALKVKMSRAALSQVLVNLIDNAVYWITHKKGKGGGGKLEIELRKLKAGFSILVSDNGPGISEEDKEIIFEPYFTKKSSGVGLGLHIGRLVIEPYGKLLLSDKGRLGGAAFEARFEQGVGL